MRVATVTYASANTAASNCQLIESTSTSEKSIPICSPANLINSLSNSSKNLIVNNLLIMFSIGVVLVKLISVLSWKYPITPKATNSRTISIPSLASLIKSAYAYLLVSVIATGKSNSLTTFWIALGYKSVPTAVNTSKSITLTKMSNTANTLASFTKSLFLTNSLAI